MTDEEKEQMEYIKNIFARAIDTLTMEKCKTLALVCRALCAEQHLEILERGKNEKVQS